MAFLRVYLNRLSNRHRLEWLQFQTCFTLSWICEVELAHFDFLLEAEPFDGH
jgi:hypothetical protein